MRLYAATGDGIARLEDRLSVAVELSLLGSGAHASLSIRTTRTPSSPACARVVCDARKMPDGTGSTARCPVRGLLPRGQRRRRTPLRRHRAERVFRSDDRGETWRQLDALLELPSRPSWSFPPRPWTSHVRWIAPSPYDGDLLLVGIELGGLMRSADRGETWDDHRPGAQRDVHSLAWHPPIKVGPTRPVAAVLPQRRRRRDLAPGRRRQRPELHLVGRSRSGRPRLLVPLGEHRPVRRPRPRRPAGTALSATREGAWRPLGGGLPEPLPSMPYALVAAEGGSSPASPTGRSGRATTAATAGPRCGSTPTGRSLRSSLWCTPATDTHNSTLKRTTSDARSGKEPTNAWWWTSNGSFIRAPLAQGVAAPPGCRAAYRAWIDSDPKSSQVAAATALADRLVAGIRAQDSSAISALFADDVQFRALTPPGLRERSSAEETGALIAVWYAHSVVLDHLDTWAAEIGDRLHISYRFSGVEEGEPYVVQQHLFCVVRDDGRIERADLLCSGFRPPHERQPDPA